MKKSFSIDGIETASDSLQLFFCSLRGFGTHKGRVTTVTIPASKNPNLAAVFPNRERFAQSDLGFLA
jgi:hypothetical protein